MATRANIHIERLPEGVYLATSEDIPGLVVQGKTITETIDSARNVAVDLFHAREGLGWETPRLREVEDSFEYPLIIE
jgi:predicted RNase H-like HicB family nuclease